MLNNAPTAPLYQELPYPADGVVRTAVARALKRALEQHLPELANKPNLRIIDVGCGTGETTLGIARLFPNATVVGADINDASLVKANELAAKSHARVRFTKADILSTLDAISDEVFDVAVSMGVLHHLRDPAEGFQAVRKLLGPRGAFFCFVYSRYGRWDDEVVKSLLDRTFDSSEVKERSRAVQKLGLSQRQTVVEFAKNLRTRLRFGPAIDPLEMVKVYLKRNRVVHLADTFSNPCEHLFTFADLEAMLAGTGWSWIALADGFGIPTSIEAHTSDPSTQKILARMTRAALCDYFAFVYRAWGFGFLVRPQA